MVIIGCSFEANVVEEAVKIGLWRNKIEELNKGKCFGDVAGGDREGLREAEDRDEFGDIKNGAEAGRTGLIDEGVEVL